MTPEIPAELRSLTWLSPWVATDADFTAELKREVGRGHVLYDRPAVAVARRLDQDDVLFWLPAGPGLLAAVHLTYAGRERSPQWPWTQLFASVEEWVEKRMRVDHDEHMGTTDAADP